ncbi:hypothetical protein CN918_25945 [Priestia megaterium]|nr:hypothetical protein CN918_25945 [Priestia megaterium]
MRKMMRYLVVFSFIVISMFFISSYTHAASNSTTYIKILKDDTAIMDNRKGSNQPLIQVGSLKKGQVFPATYYGKNWWKISYGNSYGYVYSPSAMVVPSPEYKNGNTKLANSPTLITTKVKTTVYDNTSGSLVPFATLKENMRYPVIASYGPNWWTIDVGGRIGYIYKPAVTVDNGIPVLMYHHFLTKEENKNFVGVSTTITPQAFDEQMNYLKKAGYETITPADLELFINGKINLPAKSVVLTFDDGLKSNYLYAYPILKKYDFKATNFVITSRMTPYNQTFNPDSIQSLSTLEMTEMKDVYSFEGHTNNLHYFLNGKGAILSTLFTDVLVDLQTNRLALKDFSQAYYLAYPFGHYDSNTIEAAKQAGFRMAFTTKKGLVKVGDAPYEINRLNVGPEVTLSKFQQLVQVGY